ncbi:MAG: TetR/AcrR family transcriptional regulator [Actinomycetota bacterium]
MPGFQKTARGQETRARIIAAAADLIGERGVALTSLDDVIGRAGVSKGQLYHYFENRAALLHEVIAHNTETVLAAQAPYLRSLDSWPAIRAWLDSLVELQVAGRAVNGCPIGALVSQLAEGDETARRSLAASFGRWEAPVRDGLHSMQAAGRLAAEADPGQLATATLAAIQGGLLLSQVRRDPGQLAIALDAAYAHLRSHAPARPTS